MASTLVYFVDNVMTTSGLTLYLLGGSPGDMKAYCAWVRFPGALDKLLYTNFIHRQSANIAWVDGHISSRRQDDGFVTSPTCFTDYWRH